MAPRVRFAPSPTGYLHVGGARTALFNWLFARRTAACSCCASKTPMPSDRRPRWSTASSTALRWLGLDWDEGPGIGGEFGPYFQSERLDRHRAMAERLVASGHAYYCYCTAETLQGEARRRGAGRLGVALRSHLLRV